MRPAWEKCPACDDFFCTYHGMHAWECDCPAIEWWAAANLDPYTDPYPFPEQG
jgi:hypothetical protein